MKGFSVNIGGKDIFAALSDGSCGVILNCRYGKGRIEIVGTDDALRTYKWLDCELEPDACVSVRFGEIGHVSEPEEIRDPSQISDERKARLQTQAELEAYRALKQELTDEGLIGP